MRYGNEKVGNGPGLLAEFSEPNFLGAEVGRAESLVSDTSGGGSMTTCDSDALLPATAGPGNEGIGPSADEVSIVMWVVVEGALRVV